jgi:predicted nucleotidyltransferase
MSQKRYVFDDAQKSKGFLTYQKRNKELEVISLYSGNYKAEFYLRQISKLAKLPLKTCQNVLINLEKKKILKSKVEGKNKYFSLNLDNIQTKSILLQAEIYRTDVFLEKYSQFKTFLKELKTNIPIIVFGSFAKLTADKDSDLDLLIISEKEQKLPFHLLSYKVHEVNLSENSFIKAVKEQETLIKEIEEKHIVLNNHSVYVNIMWEQYGK